MCGRFKYSRKDKLALAKELGVSIEDIPDFSDEFHPEQYMTGERECPPGSMQSVARQIDGVREFVDMRWGFNLTMAGKRTLVFNTKSENVLESRMWKPRFTKDRCIVPASAFYEWKKANGKMGQKYAISVAGRESFGFAGLWGNWTNPKTNQVEATFSIFTTAPNEMFTEYHNRQPVILDPSEYEEWLAPSERPPVHLLRILPAEKMAIAQVEIDPTLS